MAPATHSDNRDAIRRVTGPTGAEFSPFGWYAVDAAGNKLVRRGYRYGDMPPRFKSGETAAKSAPAMFVRVAIRPPTPAYAIPGPLTTQSDGGQDA